MHACDIHLDAHNWTVLARHYVGQDEMGSAEKILRHMETTLTDDQPMPASSSFRADKQSLIGPISQLAGWIPRPNLVTYTTILRGLIDQGRLEEAKQFKQQMKSAGYVTPGVSAVFFDELEASATCFYSRFHKIQWKLCLSQFGMQRSDTPRGIV